MADLFGPSFGPSPGWDPSKWGGKGSSTGYDPNGSGGTVYVPGTSGQEQDVERYRGMGSTSSTPATIDQTQSNASRYQQQSALTQTGNAMGLARNAALGRVPSAAEIYGGKLIDNSINSQLAMANSVRGGPSALGAAQRQAAFSGAQTQQEGARDLAAMRAQEMAQGRDQYLGAANAYAGQAGAIRGQDIGVATNQAGFDDAGMGRNQQNQQYYEKLAWDTNKAALDQQQRADEASKGHWGQQQAAQRANKDADWGIVKDIASGVGGLLGAFSDVRSKENIAPIGASSSDGLVRENSFGEAPPMPGGGVGLGGVQLRGGGGVSANDVRSASAGSSSAGMFGAPGGGGITGGNVDLYGGGNMTGGGVGGGGLFSGLVRQNPFGGINPMASLGGAYRPITSDANAKYILSDANAKRAAFLDGINHGDAMTEYMQGTGPVPTPPKYMPNTRDPHGGVGMISHDKPTEYDTMTASRPSHKDDDPMAAANRAQQGSAYTYRPEFAAQSGQAPGEINVGPMAQTMAADPVAGTAVKRGPGGMLVLDGDKLQKVQSAGISSLQRQIDTLKGGQEPTYAPRRERR